MSDEHVVRWPHVIAHAALALVLVSVYVGLPIGTFASNAWTAFTIWIVAAIVAFLSVGVASYLKQAGNSTAVCIGGAAAIVVVGLGVAVWHSLTADEVWNGPLVEANGRLEQPLGFSFAKPPPSFVESSDVESHAKLGSDEAVYVFVDRTTSSSLEIEIRRTPSDGRHAIEDIVKQRAAWLGHAGSGGTPIMQLTGGGVDGDDANPVGRLQAQGRGHTMRSTYHLLRTHRGNYSVGLIVVSIDPNVLSDVLDSYRGN